MSSLSSNKKLQNIDYFSTKLATINAMETDMAGMLGRLRFDVKAIIGFARLTAGDSFDIIIKHGSQKWKTRGKTQNDRSQVWEQTSITFNCQPNIPITIKTLELKFLKSKCLNEKNFNPAKFFTPYSQLITMSLNTIGSIKLQLIVTWLPLLSSCVPIIGNINNENIYPLNLYNNNMQKQDDLLLRQKANNLSPVNIRSKSFDVNNPVNLKNELTSFNYDKTDRIGLRRASAKSLLLESNSTNNNIPLNIKNFNNENLTINNNNNIKCDIESPSKICLREKKREREHNGKNLTPNSSSTTSNIYSSIINIGNPLDKDRWRHSSTTVLDSLYKDLSKNIPTIDDLSALKVTKKLQKSSDSDKCKNEKGIILQPHRSVSSASNSSNLNTKKQEKNWNKSASVANLNANNNLTENEIDQFNQNILNKQNCLPLKNSNINTPILNTNTLSGFKKNKLSNLKKNRNYPANFDYYAKIPIASNISPTTTTTTPAINRPFSTYYLLNNSTTNDSNSHFLQLNNHLEHRPSTSSINSDTNIKSFQKRNNNQNGPIDVMNFNALKTANTLLELIETLRKQLLLANDTDINFNELVSFEACMLNLEAVLKLNRASMIEESRAPTLNYNKNNNSRLIGSRNGIRNINNNRTSLYLPHSSNNQHFFYHNGQHSPSTTSDELNDEHTIFSGFINSGGSSVMDQISENDSGIDSLRQNFSPFNHVRNTSYTETINETVDSNTVQQRFNEFKDRRKSLGGVLDSLNHSTDEKYNLQSKNLKVETLTFNVNNHPPLSSSTSSSSADSRCNNLDNIFKSATGNVEIDECLYHHLTRAIGSIELLIKLKSTPFEFTISEMLNRMEQDTITLELLLRLIGQLPLLPNIHNIFNELNVSNELRELWQTICYLSKLKLIVSSNVVYQNLKKFVAPIVVVRYPNLIKNVVDSIMNFICERSGKWSNTKVTIFQFVSFFNNKQIKPFIENIAHEAWITSNLLTAKVENVKEVMLRLKNVPVVPPLESLRQICLVLASVEELSNNPLIQPIEAYLNEVSIQLANDLAACYMCILEHEDLTSQIGACRALAILQRENSINHLEFVATNNNADDSIRYEAQIALNKIIEKNQPIYYQFNNNNNNNNINKNIAECINNNSGMNLKATKN